MILSSLVYVRRAAAGGGETLMIRKARGDGRGLWNGLGGKFEPGESPEACARREVREEAGLELGALEWRGLLTFPRFDGAVDWYVFVFVCGDFRGEPRASDEGELRWLPTARLHEQPLQEGDRVFLPWLQQRRFFSAVLRYRDGRFAGHEVSFYDPPGGRPSSPEG